MIRGNSGPCCNGILCCIPCCWPCVRFEVPANHFAMVINQAEHGKKTVLYGPGYHNVGYFNHL